MNPLEAHLEQAKRRLADRSVEFAGRFEQWRLRADGQGSTVDAALAASDDGPAEISSDSAERDEVLDRIARGELSWMKVLSGDVDDDAERALSLQMDRRVQKLEHVGQRVRAGVPLEDAYLEIVKDDRWA